MYLAAKMSPGTMPLVAGLIPAVGAGGDPKGSTNPLNPKLPVISELGSLHLVPGVEEDYPTPEEENLMLR